MNKAIRFKLFLMMVLEFFIWGAWLPLIFGYLPSLGFTADGTILDPQRLPDRRHRRHVLQQPVRGPEFRGGKDFWRSVISSAASPSSVAGVGEGVLAVLRG